MRHMRDAWMDNFFLKIRNGYGMGTVYTQPRKECVEQSLDSLRNNHVLFILFDQNFGTGGVFVDFFGKQAATAKGPIVFALRSNSPIVPMFTFRDKNNQHKVVILPEVELLQGKDKEETIELNAAKLTKIIESFVRKHPSEWAWIHRRWKARPQAERDAIQKKASFDSSNKSEETISV